MAYHFDPVDWEQLRLTGQLSAGQRIQRLLDARELAVGLIRGRLRQQYPDLSTEELNLKVLAEIERAKAIRPPDFSLFIEILRTLEAINAPYMLIGAFAATVYGITRTTYDIDMVVNLNENHIRRLVAAFPPPILR